MKTPIETLIHLTEDIKVAMLTTVTSRGAVQSRPMLAQGIDENGCLWFFTRADSKKTSEIRKDQHVNVAYVEPKDSKYVSVSGTATLVTDPAFMEQLYQPAFNSWFPAGLNTPDLILIRVQAEAAEFWDAPAGKMVELLSMAMSQITGNPYPSQLREHETVRLGKGTTLN